MKTVLIVGGGPAGCAAAHQLILQGGWRITMVERSNILGAGVRTSWYGGHPYTFGPRHFLTQNEAVYQYMNAIVPLRSVAEHEFLTYVERDNAFYHYPLNMEDVKVMPDREGVLAELGECQRIQGAKNAKNLEDYWIASIGRTLYSKVIEGYNKKMWQVDDNRRIDTFNWSPKGATIKEGAFACWDGVHSCYPYAPDGYNHYFDVAVQGVDELRMNTEIERYDIPNKTVVIDGERRTFDVIVSTIAPDILMNRTYGELPFIGRDLHKLVFPAEDVFPPNVYFLYYANDEKFTRMVEYKRFTRHKSPTTLIGLEIPSMNGKYYPLPFQSEIERAERYFQDMPTGVFSIGRAGTYRYAIDFDDCVEQTMEMVETLAQGGQDHPVPVAKWREINVFSQKDR
jgi:UDP-galactopyranose mutase